MLMMAKVDEIFFDSPDGISLQTLGKPFRSRENEQDKTTQYLIDVQGAPKK